MIKVDGKYGHGGIKPSLLRRVYRKAKRPLLGQASVPFDWSNGYDVETTIKLVRKDQNGSFSCGGQAGAYFLEAKQKLKGKQEVISAKSIYSPIYAPGGGVGIDALETRIGAHGGNLEASVPSYQSGLPPQEPFMEDDSWETPSLDTDALTRAGYLPHRISIDIDSLAEAIRDTNGIIIMLEGQNNGTWDSQFPQPPSRTNPNPTWYHYIYFKGATVMAGKKYLLGLNSWGATVGSDGVQYFGEDYVPHFITATSFLPYTQVSPVQSNISEWANVIRWFKRTFLGMSVSMA